MAKQVARGAVGTKMIYYFGKTRTEGRGLSKALLGGKGINLAEMTGIGLPVPPGFTITTEVCDLYYKEGRKMPEGLMVELQTHVKTLEKELEKKFGDSENPLLVSVRSGAAVSMPGMMDTILNLGLTDESVQGLARATGNERFAYDAYRRLINMFGGVVMEVKHELFEEAFSAIKKKYKATLDTDVPTEGLKELCEAYEAIYQKATGSPFPQDPLDPAETGDRGGVQELDDASSRSLPRSRGNSGIAWDGRQCPVDGVRQHGRGFRDGSRVHP
jgi:pyruvate, orthophosphate dikinase